MDTPIRYIKLGGGMSTATKALNGLRFVNGLASVRASDQDFVKFLRYFGRCYQAKEVDVHGERTVRESRPERPVPPLEGGVSESGGITPGTADVVIGGDDTEVGPEKPKAKRGRPKRSAPPVEVEGDN